MLEERTEGKLSPAALAVLTICRSGDPFEMLEMRLRGSMGNRVALALDGPAQGANGAKFSLFRKQRAALRASAFGWGCRHVSSWPPESYSNLLRAHEKNRWMNAVRLKEERQATIRTLLQETDL